MTLLDHCERLMVGLMKVKSSLKDVEADPFNADTVVDENFFPHPPNQSALYTNLPLYRQF